ncbi:hypothetical protein DM02DRAFT_30652 [Periconia macrospinosa]|uniref:Uncharacterized protein n=1 Tax=Periconia macrospinosa TaxID=97972 RepID=A0A2V1DKK7_9PLEO|nr:hypothetical protein DM02DRAFT_30652 [Periconia macrospinosa]
MVCTYFSGTLLSKLTYVDGAKKRSSKLPLFLSGCMGPALAFVHFFAISSELKSLITFLIIILSLQIFEVYHVHVDSIFLSYRGILNIIFSVE